MNLYDLPEIKKPKFKVIKNKVFWFIISSILLSTLFGFLAGMVSGSFFYFEIKEYLEKIDINIPDFEVSETEYIPPTSHEDLLIKAVENVDPAVVSIVITKDVPIYEQYYYDPFEGFGGIGSDFLIPQYRQNGTEKKEVGGGTGFIVSKDGMILTNKHVALDKEAEYTVFTNDGKTYPAKVLARDPLQDIAVLKIDQDKIVTDGGELILNDFPVVKLGDSSGIKIGQTVVAIGNALGEFRNTISVGVISGLGRTISASSGEFTETLENVIQTDAAINKGNSGGPLLNLRGEVIGINTAMVQDAQSIGFAIPINDVKKGIEQARTLGKIVYPFLGVRYLLITESIQKERGLSVDYGVLLIRGLNGEPAVSVNSAADKAGLKRGDIILELNGEKITYDNSLIKILEKYNPGDTVNLKVLRNQEEIYPSVILGERGE
ncbi:MAG: trypsin-like peptidase domain-containing protein [Candidatus Nealsonbacteria bacterium]